MELTASKIIEELSTKEYFGTSGAGCLIMAETTKRFLMPLRSEWVHEPHTLGVWGGTVDEGEDPKTAAIRELKEESGYEGIISEIKHLYQFVDDTFHFDTFLTVIPEEFEPKLNWETERADWLRIDKLKGLNLHPGLEQMLSDTPTLNKLLHYVEIF